MTEKEPVRPGEAVAVDPSNPWGTPGVKSRPPHPYDWHRGSAFSKEQSDAIRAARGLQPTGIIIDELSDDEIRARRAS